jgi:hypothetical protein
VKTRKKVVLGTAVAMALFGTLGFAAPANAAAITTPPPTQTISNVAPMVPDGFRADVAAADGYRIVTNADGSQSSVPVTANAIAQQATADAARARNAAMASPGRVSPDNEVSGDYGSSWISAVKKANNTVAYSTGYVVFGYVESSQWEPEAAGFISGNSVLLHPKANSGTWSTEGILTNVVGPGFAYVNPISSFAVLASGQVCASGAPTASFG